MKRSETEFYALQQYLIGLFERKESPTKIVFIMQKQVSRFEGIIDLQGNLLTPSDWFTLSAEQIEFCNCIKAICNLHISYSNKVDMLKIYLTSF